MWTSMAMMLLSGLIFLCATRNSRKGPAAAAHWSRHFDGEHGWYWLNYNEYEVVRDHADGDRLP